MGKWNDANAASAKPWPKSSRLVAVPVIAWTLQASQAVCDKHGRHRWMWVSSEREHVTRQPLKNTHKSQRVCHPGCPKNIQKLQYHQHLPISLWEQPVKVAVNQRPPKVGPTAWRPKTTPWPSTGWPNSTWPKSGWPWPGQAKAKAKVLKAVGCCRFFRFIWGHDFWWCWFQAKNAKSDEDQLISNSKYLSGVLRHNAVPELKSLEKLNSRHLANRGWARPGSPGRRIRFGGPGAAGADSSLLQCKCW